MTLCQCGCGQPAPIAARNRPDRGYAKGEALRFRPGHALVGGRCRHSNGYIGITDASSPRKANGDGRIPKYEHLAVVERALGHPLPAGAEVHHVDENRANNANTNLVACQDHTYHMLLHRRLRAFRASGNPDYRKCGYCHQWDDPANLLIYKTSYSARHHACQNRYAQRYATERRLSRET